MIVFSGPSSPLQASMRQERRIVCEEDQRTLQTEGKW